MMRQCEALENLDGIEVVSVTVRGDDTCLRSFIITTADGALVDVCVFDNHLRVTLYTAAEAKNMEW